MSQKVTIGGKRLGSGKKMDVELRNYSRSTHDLGYIWRSTMASGTLVPFMSEVALKGDTFDIDLEVDVKTHPTIGPLFGSYKVQLDVFSVPIRHYKAELHNNNLDVGLKMATMTLPQLKLTPTELDFTKNLDNQQINPSSLLAYLGIRGLGRYSGTVSARKRNFNAVPFLGYWDIYKNYYANKPEGIGAFIHTEMLPLTAGVQQIVASDGTDGDVLANDIPTGSDYVVLYENGQSRVGIETQTPNLNVKLQQIQFAVASTANPLSGTYTWVNGEKLFREVKRINTTQVAFEGFINYFKQWNQNTAFLAWRYTPEAQLTFDKPEIKTFELKNIDKMKERIFKAWGTTVELTDYASGETKLSPYHDILHRASDKIASRMFSQEGLGLKTYQSDLFNNWINTDWITGTNGINAITAVDTSSGSFNIDALNLATKVWEMLNRVAVSGGSYDDWLEAVYPTGAKPKTEIPQYQGGLIRELIFQEVISTAENSSSDILQPLGTLAGRGVMAQKRKGGKIVIKPNEHCYIMGIVSITPRIDYSQGNKWDMNLKTMDDFHKPALDEIGFQDLITDQMAWWDTNINASGPQYNSAGKQPAWLNYMTNVNRTYGNFAIADNEMFMTLNRRYEYSSGVGTAGIKDLTTYIDPSKFNFIFANTAIDSQNFWVQIGVDIEARRLMSAKVIPNL